MSPVLRWILILPAAIATWYATLFTGIALYQGVEALCPPDQVESGHCFAPWFLTASNALIVFGAALAAVLVMFVSASLAPAHKRQVAIATFALGTLVAISMGWKLAVAPMLGAIVAGAIVLVILLRRYASLSRPNKSLEQTREG
jgi:MFS family permease